MPEQMTEPAVRQYLKQTGSAVERIAAFAAAARPEQLTSDVRRLFKRNILDSLGCAIAALPGQLFRAFRNSSGNAELRARAR
jgi:2-methylcitrate dehydratase PrpD